MKYKMVVLDLDDTLLKSNGEISENNKKALKMAQEKGVKVVLASGRPTFAMKNLANELELGKYGGYILSFNGSKILDCKNNEILFEEDLTKEQIQQLYDIALENNVFIHTYVGDEIITPKSNKYTNIENEITGMPIKVFENFIDILPEKCVKVILLEEPSHLKNLEKKLIPILNGKMTMTITKPFFLEFMNKNVDKGKSILKLCNILGINKEEIIAIGDSYNDISMIEVAGIGVAMGNAVKEVKEIANFITDTNENDGVAKAIEKYILMY